MMESTASLPTAAGNLCQDDADDGATERRISASVRLILEK